MQCREKRRDLTVDATAGGSLGTERALQRYTVLGSQLQHNFGTQAGTGPHISISRRMSGTDALSVLREMGARKRAFESWRTCENVETRVTT